MLTSTLLSLPTIVFSALTSVDSGLVIKVLVFPAVLGLVTIITTLGVWQKLKETALDRQGTTKRQGMLGKGLVFFNAILALLWFIVGTITMVKVSTLLTTEWYSRDTERSYDVVPAFIWTQGYLSYAISCLKWAEVASAEYYRYQFEKAPLMGTVPPHPDDKILWRKHTKWILCFILASIAITFLEFGLALGDGALGGYSLWMIPAAAILSQIVHWLTIPLWRRTAKSRRGTNRPPFIYSTTLLVLTGFLTLVWVVASIVSFLTTSSKFDNSRYIQWTVKYRSYKLLYYVRWCAAAISALAAVLVFAQFWLIAHYRAKYFKRARSADTSANVAHPSSYTRQSITGTTLATPGVNKVYDAAEYVQSELPKVGPSTSSYSARSQLPSPSLVYSPYASQYGPPQQPSAQHQTYVAANNSTHDMMISAPRLSYNPTSRTYPTSNPLYQS
ncbi:hypothetical protein FRC18_010189 [Serendipita sp. 400]|nr:hypothetical protein FRC18_010189 [Serendipita sp. 400]